MGHKKELLRSRWVYQLGKVWRYIIAHSCISYRGSRGVLVLVNHTPHVRIGLQGKGNLKAWDARAWGSACLCAAHAMHSCSYCRHHNVRVYGYQAPSIWTGSIQGS